FSRAEVTERLMGTLLVVPTDPPPHRAAGLGEAREAVLPDALFLQAAEEAFDHPVLLRRVRRDEFLAQALVPTRGAEATALEDQAVVEDARMAMGWESFLRIGHRPSRG